MDVREEMNDDCVDAEDDYKNVWKNAKRENLSINVVVHQSNESFLCRMINSFVIDMS